MRRLVFLLFVLSLSASASAVLVFTLDDEPQPAEITLQISDYVELGLKWEPPGEGVFCYDLVYQLSNSKSELIASGVTFPAKFEFPGFVLDSQPQYVEITASQFLNPPYQGTDPLMQGLVLHCLGYGDVLLQVVSLFAIIDEEEIPEGTIIHTLLIHQVPEPMTLTLFALGGLFLARRKK